MLRSLIPLHRLITISTQLKPTTSRSNLTNFTNRNKTMSTSIPNLSTLNTPSTTDTPVGPVYEISKVPEPKEGEKPYIETAAVLIIGDEVLNGKTKDTNSNHAAQMFFDLGIELKRIEVIADDEDEIIEAVKRMHKNYDLVITSGGIGPTHDDITYASIAKAFNTPLIYDQETIKRMETLTKKREGVNEEQKLARLRMALFPEGAEVLFVKPELWVPVVRVGGKVCILPGVPSLFQRLLEGFASKFIHLPPSSSKPFRLLVHTEMPESSIAPFLTKLQARIKDEGIRVGSYPKLFQAGPAGVDVSLIGKDHARLIELAEEVVTELKGTVISGGKLGEEVASTSSSSPAKM